MTAFTTADIPASVDTVEKLHAWSASILAELNPSATAIEGPGTSVRTASANAFFIPEGPSEPEYRYICRTSLKLEGDWRTGKIWENVEAISNTAIPAAYKS